MKKNIFSTPSVTVLDHRVGGSSKKVILKPLHSVSLFSVVDDDEDGYKSEVCVWLSDDKKISQSLQQKQHQSEQDEDDSLF